MIPVIRSISELMAITESRKNRREISKDNEIHSSTKDSEQRKKYIKSHAKTEVDLPDLPRKIRREWNNNKEVISKFFDDLDYNNQIQSSYDLTLLARQSKTNQKDAA